MGPLSGPDGHREVPALAERLRGTVVPAVLTPISADGTAGLDALASYAAALVAAPIGGVAVWAHTGRALYLTRDERCAVLRVWRQSTQLPVVAGAGVPMDQDRRDTGQALTHTLGMALDAAKLGADAIMVYPPTAFAGDPHGDDLLLDLHQRVAAETGLPVLGFHLHDEGGGYRYHRRLLDRLLGVPGMLGIKTATLSNAITCQDTIIACREAGALAITGEDRMFGPSYLWGADAALVGIAAAAVELTTAVAEAWGHGDAATFVAASQRLDRFAAVTFDAPIEGYVQRMMWVAVAQGWLHPDFAHDPFGPALPASERDRVVAAYREAYVAHRR